MIGRTASDRNHPARRAGLQRFSKRQRGRKILRGNPFSGFTRFLQHKRHKTPHKNQYTTTAKRDKTCPVAYHNKTRRTRSNARTAVHHNASPTTEANHITNIHMPKNPENHSKNKNEKTKSRHHA